MPGTYQRRFRNEKRPSPATLDEEISTHNSDLIPAIDPNS